MRTGSYGPYSDWNPLSYPALPSAIRHERRQARKTQADLSADTGISRSMLAQLETGKKNLTSNHWYKLCQALPALAEIKVRHTWYGVKPDQ